MDTMAKPATEGPEAGATTRMLKVVYFDEDSASDYLDIAAGGRAVSSTEKVKTRSTELRASVLANLKAKFSFLPGLLSAGAKIDSSFEASSAGQSVLRKTISNTILTDYLARVTHDRRVEILTGMTVMAPDESMSFMKMYTPFTAVLKQDRIAIDFTKLDEAFVAAKGYYELVGSSNGAQSHILRFNFASFRNNYRLSDLTQMRLVYHGVLVGEARADQLGIDAVINRPTDLMPTPAEVIAGVVAPGKSRLPVYDILLAGVESSV